MRTRLACLLILLIAVSASRCNPFGPSCLSRQQTGTAGTVSGTVDAQTVAVHEIAYATEGSQNDLKIQWPGRLTAGGPRLRMYATRVECVDFVAPPSLGANNNTGACADVGSWGGTLSPDARACAVDRTCQPIDSDLVQSSLIITHGRGNPEKLGPSARYKLWVVTTSEQPVGYTITITWFFGPDC